MNKYSYKQEFLDLGFTSIKDHGAEKPQCVLCYKVLSNASLKKNKLKRHLETKHPQHAKKNRIFFQHRETELIRSRICSETNPALLASKQATLASYVVSLRIDKEMKSHAIGERLVKPAAIDMATLMCGDNVASKLQSVSLSNDTVKSRIADLSLNIKIQVVARMKKAGKWSYQLDESIDTGKNAQLMVYVRYEGDMDLKEEFLFCTPLTTTATGADIFNVVDNFQQEEGINWENCVSLCTDGAPAMLGARHGFTARVRQINASVQVVHCLLHCENLAAQHLSLDLSAVMKEVVGVVNFIKASAVNSGLFEQLCVGHGSRFKHLLFYSNVRWLSRGKLLRRLIDLRTEVQVFLNEKNHRHAIRFQDKEWMLKVCYLNDIFTTLNELNTSMQGRNQNIITLSEKLSAFKEKLQLWKNKLEHGQTAAFPSMNGYLEEWNQTDSCRFDVIKPTLVEHLENLITEFDCYLPDINLEAHLWVRNPFLAKVDNLSQDVAGLQEELIDLHHDQFHRQLLSTASLGEFWTSVKKEKPIIGNEAMTFLLPFSTTYLCEQGFSALTVVKT